MIWVAPVEVIVNARLQSINKLSNEGWQGRKWRRTKEREATRVALERALAHGAVFPAWPIVTITRVAARRLDGDNLQGSAKIVRDSIASFMGVSDGGAAIEWRYDQEHLWFKEQAWTHRRGPYMQLRSFVRVRFESRVERAIGHVDARCAA